MALARSRERAEHSDRPRYLILPSLDENLGKCNEIEERESYRRKEQGKNRLEDDGLEEGKGGRPYFFNSTIAFTVSSIGVFLSRRWQ